MSKLCGFCEGSFEGHANAKYCSPPCKYRAREASRADGPRCSVCEAVMWGGPNTASKPMCQPCRRAQPGYRVKSRPPTHEWECISCGVCSSRPTSRGQVPKWCEKCRRASRNRGASGGIKISRAERLAIYLRDSWTCWLCQEAVDSELVGTRTNWSPSLDHVITRAKGGSDDSSNLRLAHMWCNSIRANDRVPVGVFHGSL